MAFDGLLLHALTTELNNELAGGRIDRVYQPEKELLILHIRNNRHNHKLLITTKPDAARLHLTNDNFSNPLHPPSFCMALRKHLEGGRIAGLRQQGLDRIVSLEIETYDELGEPTTRKLLCELMGKHSNVLLLTENMKIIDALKRFGGAVNEYREILPGLPYTPPPAQDKVNPFTLTEDNFVALLLDQPLNKKIDRALLAILSGFSPQSCTEVVLRAGFSPSLKIEQCGQYDFTRLWQTLKEMLAEIEQATYQPTLVKAGERYKQFSVFDLTTGLPKEHYPTLNEALDKFFTAKRNEQRVQELRSRLNTKLTNEIERLKKKIAINHQKLQQAADAQELRIFGELITANIYRLKQGQKELTTENFYTGETVTIPLKPELTPAENAQHYFKRYQKIKKGGKLAEQFLEQTQNQLHYLESVQQSVTSADSLSDLEEIWQELISAGILEQKQQDKRKKDKQPQSEPRCFLSSEGITILVGKNNRQNDQITLKTAKQDHTWLHVKDIPGSHVVILAADFSQKTLEEAAVLAAYYSKARNSANVPVDYTLVKHVRKPRGAKPGMVIYDHQKTVFVTPDETLIQDLKKN